MTTLLSRIRADQIQLRKSRESSERVALLTTLLSEAANVGLNDGKRESTDAEVIAVIKKFIKGIDETLALRASDALVDERTILEGYLPSQLSITELIEIVYHIVDDIVEELEMNGPTMKMMGQVMKTLKGDYEGRYDGKMASDVVKDALAK